MKRLCLTLLVAVLLPLLAVMPASAAPTQAITVSVEPVAVASVDRASLSVHITVSCPANYAVLEAFVYVVQGAQQSSFVGIPLTCRPRGQQYTLTVPAPEGFTWSPGEASLSGYILLQRRSTTLTASPAASLEIVIP